MLKRGSTALAIVLAVALASPASAQREKPEVRRDAQGRITETRERESTGTVVRRNAQGERLGTIERGTGGRLIERDPQGRRTGTIERR